MKIPFLATIASSVIGVAALFIACTPQARNNQFDPEGTAFNAAARNPFAGTNLVIDYTLEGGNSVLVKWPPASETTFYRIYISSSQSRPSTPALTNVTNTNAYVNLVSIGSNFIWVEAEASSNFIIGSCYIKTGWRMNTDGHYLQSMNIPVGQTRLISFPGTLTGAPAVSVAYSRVTLWNVASGGTFDITFIVSNANATNSWTNSIPSTARSMSNGITVTGTVGAGPGGCTVSVKNVSDSDGFNIVQIEYIYLGGASVAYTNAFTTTLNSDLIGDLER